MKRRGFTLVELLVVLGIIAVLVGFLLVATRRGSESARQVQCASNLRQLTAALTAYAQDNDGLFPGAGLRDFGASPEDWLYWEDPEYRGRPVTASPVMKYMKGASTELLRCPSDDPTVRPRINVPPGCRYSYSLNILFASLRGPAGAVPASPGPKVRLSAVVTPAQKMMLFDEDAWSLNDASYDPTIAPGDGGENFLATRHGKQAKDWHNQTSNGPTARIDRTDKGNVAYADGHVDMVPRAETWQPMYFDPSYRGGRDPLR